jgi:hypothetical protein
MVIYKFIFLDAIGYTLHSECLISLVQHMGDFNYPRLADFGAAISGANKFLCQEVLEELDVRNFLKLHFF